MSERAGQKMADKLDRSATSVTTRSSATPSEFTFSTTPESEVKLVIDSTATAAPLRIKKKSKSNLVPAPSTPEGSSCWSQSVNIWEPELDEGFAQQVEAEKQHSQKRTAKTSSSLVISKELEAATRKSFSEKTIRRQSGLTSEGDSKPASSHIRKTMRKSQSERRVTRLSPMSNISEDHHLSPRESFRAFLLQDRITQSQRDITRPQLAQRERITQSPREEIKPPLAEQMEKRKTKRSKTKREHSMGSSRATVKQATPSQRDIKKPQLAQREKITQSLREIMKPPLAEQTEKRKTKRSKSKREHSTGSSRAPVKQPTTLIDISASRSRLLKKKQMSMSKLDTSHPQLLDTATITPRPSLHSIFEWTRSPTSNQESEGPVNRRHSLHRSPSSQGLMDRRKLMRKRRSSSDIHQYHVTPEWPSQKRNAKLRSLFYDLSVRRKMTDKDSAGVPSISAKDMLRIMEPCSRREILTAQGKELEPPLYREDFVFNYGDVIDGISLTSTQATK